MKSVVKVIGFLQGKSVVETAALMFFKYLRTRPRPVCRNCQLKPTTELLPKKDLLAHRDLVHRASAGRDVRKNAHGFIVFHQVIGIDDGNTAGLWHRR